ncbi:hypothetical protein GPECTOR_28g748 [Gonium pectorale]|uniref:PPM-type phosphatase domain-containing protein n=1 Tax=Gonium pectorale TaxID=33097 RepID=A0A150GEQ4_GONPE|nr:hypothetical protein GPECTOR_28g748 [Gonium pectorale]|eukprot:KXZ48341.1 hypothetical protein GPECTOR_28g748 [Gonium pectorale]
MGVLATTRAFGDLDLKQFGVTAEPEVTSVPRCPDDELLILATDGVSNVLTNEEVADVARRVVRRAQEKGAPRAAAIRMAASAIGRFSRDRNSKDDITVIVVDLTPPAVLTPDVVSLKAVVTVDAAGDATATGAVPVPVSVAYGPSPARP